MTGKSILITGCSSGIGHHIAHALHGRGWQVLATCRKAEDVARLQEEGLACHLLDLTDAASIRAGFDWAMEQTGGRLGALYNNGAFGMAGAIEDTSTDGFRSIFETNFFGWHELTRHVIPVMRQQGAGRIVQCSSVLGFAALKMRGPYVSTKYALEGYTDVLRLELRGTGIDVILLEPGPIDTAFRINARPHYEAHVEKEHSAWADFYKKRAEPRLYAETLPPDRWELTCEATTAKLIHALESPRPNARYFVTRPTYILAWARRLLPTRALDWVLAKA
ncbi:MAG: SDR family NAD(P)-dependent oxidoreductase [Pseudomonadota bacterium]